MSLTPVPNLAADLLDSVADAPSSPPAVTLLLDKATNQVGFAVGSTVSFRDLFVSKGADQTVNNSTVLVNDSALALSVVANAKYILEAYVKYDSGTTPDIKFAWTGPAGATLDWIPNTPPAGATGVNSALSVGNTAIGDGAAVAAGGVGAGTAVVAHMTGTLTVAGTAGSLQLRWAQNTGDASDTKVLAGSWLRLTRVA
jgi:hypothetical protein